MNKPVLELASIKKSFSKGSSNKIEVLKGVDLQLFPGEIVALVAPSGACLLYTSDAADDA